MTPALPQHTILVVDDSPEDRATYRRYLTGEAEHRYHIVEAEFGRGILALCQQVQPAAVLLDYCLPDLDGLKALEHLKQYNETLPVIMLTGQGDETVAAQAIKKGAEDYLVKGQTSPSKLQLVVQNAIENADLRQQLQQREQQFRIAVNNLFDCFGIYTAVRDGTGEIVDFQVEYLNAAACQYQQALSDERQIGQRLCEIFPENRDNGLFEAYCQVVETGLPLVRELLSYADGQPLRVKRATEIRVSKSNDGFVATWRDITYRKQLEQDRLALIEREQAARQAAEYAQEQYRLVAQRSQESQRFIEQIANTTPGILYVYDLQAQRNIYVNDQVATLLGYSPEQIQAMGGELFAQLFHPEDLAQLPAHIAQFDQAQPGEILSMDYRMRHTNGEWRWFRGREVVFRRTAAGAPWQILGIAQDITNLKQIQERYELAAIAVNCLIYDWDVHTQSVTRSQGILPLIGYTPEEAGTDLNWWSDRIHPDDRSRVSEEWETVTAQQDRIAVEYRVRHREGHYIWVLDHAVALRDAEGTIIRVVGSTRDISDRKNAEAVLEAARAEAEAANQAKDDFIAVISHELRSPLNSMLGWTRLIKMGKIDAETLPQALQAIERGAQAQVQLVDDLLDISRIIRGKLNLIFTPFNIASVLEIAIHLARPTAEAKQIHLEQQIDSSATLLVSGDSQRIQQVVGNLLTNAVKFTPPGGQITVGLERVESLAEGQEADDEMQLPSPYPHSNLPAPGYAKITVTDTGKGISAELLPHIFDRFRQDKRSGGKTKDGLGLGLAIVQQLVEMHQGKVSADSPGQGLGATFTILLPLIQQSTEVNPTSTPSSVQPLLECSGIRILVVDDELEVVDYLKFVLESQGAIVATATTANSGFAQLLSFKPDLLMSDIGMPEEDGYALIRRIRGLEDAEGGQIPAIALTAFAQPNTREQVLAAGFQLYLKKPIEPENLVEAIVNLLQKPS